MKSPALIALRNEATDITANPMTAQAEPVLDGVAVHRTFSKVPAKLEQSWSPTPAALAWELLISSEAEDAGHELAIELPVLSNDRMVFTPGERGAMPVRNYPDFQPPAYGVNTQVAGPQASRSAYMLPLVAVFDRVRDQGLTIALPADAVVPHLRVEWSEGTRLRLIFAHRRVGRIPAGLKRPVILPSAVIPAQCRAHWQNQPIG